MNERVLKKAHLSGKRFLFCLGFFLVVLPVGLFLGVRGYLNRATAMKPPEMALRWQDRASWPTSPVTDFQLEYDAMVRAETGKQYRNAAFSLAKDPAQERRIEIALLACAALARRGDSFTDEAVRKQLEAQAKALADQFYPPYLLACWYAAHDDNANAELWMTRAVKLAPAMLMEDGHRPGASIPALAIAFDRVRNSPKAHPSFIERLAHQTQEQTLNRDLVLAYPAPLADDQGRVWLPVFRDMYRWADPRKSGPLAGKDWFSMSNGVRVGHLNAPASNVPPRP